MSDGKVARVHRSKETAKASYDRMSRWYDWISGGSEKKYRDMGLRKLGIKEGEKVLEIGFGTGYCLLALAGSVGKTGRVYGIDISEGMLQVARAKLEKANFLSRVDVRQGDGLQLPYEVGLFDAVFMSFTLELFDTPEISFVLQECWRVLRSGGRICVVALSKVRQVWTVRFYEWIHVKWPEVVDCRPIFVQQSLEEAGFQIVESTITSMWGLPVEVILADK